MEPHGQSAYSLGLLYDFTFNKCKECTTFHGEWFGTCSNDDLIELKVVQESCDSIEYKEKVDLKGHVGSTKTISGQTIDRKQMASLTSWKEAYHPVNGYIQNRQIFLR